MELIKNPNDEVEKIHTHLNCVYYMRDSIGNVSQRGCSYIVLPWQARRFDVGCVEASGSICWLLHLYNCFVRASFQCSLPPWGQLCWSCPTTRATYPCSSCCLTSRFVARTYLFGATIRPEQLVHAHVVVWHRGLLLGPISLARISTDMEEHLFPILYLPGLNNFALKARWTLEYNFYVNFVEYVGPTTISTKYR